MKSAGEIWILAFVARELEIQWEQVLFLEEGVQACLGLRVCGMHV